MLYFYIDELFELIKKVWSIIKIKQVVWGDNLLLIFLHLYD